MGYQIVEVSLSAGRKKGIVYNSELLILNDEPKFGLTDSFESLVRSAHSSDAEQVRAIRVLPQARMVAENMSRASGVYRSNKPAVEGDPKRTGPGSSFVRFTAYVNDRRISANLGLLPGTYATTARDAEYVTSGRSAVERYALPDPKPAIYRYAISPLAGTVFREGIVQPANGHAGGGVEVLFDDGTTANTVTLLAPLPG